MNPDEETTDTAAPPDTSSPPPDMGSQGLPPDPGSIGPEPTSVPPDLSSEVQAYEMAEEQQLIAEEAALEEELGGYAPEPATPVTPVTPATPNAEHEPVEPTNTTNPTNTTTTTEHQPAETTTPSDLTMDSHGDPEQGTAPTSDVIGDPTQDASEWTFQQENGMCGPNSISMLLESTTGQHLSEQQVAQWAIQNGDMTHLTAAEDSPAGVPSLHYGMLPQQAVDTLNALGKDSGVTFSLETGSLSTLESDLKDGHQIMVEVDDQRLWHQPGVKDTDQANHFVVVTGIDPSTGTVFLNDPGNPYGKEESIPLKEFESSWSTSSNAMIVSSGGSSTTDGTSTSSDGSGIDSTAAAQPSPILLPVVLRGEHLTEV